MKKSNEKFVLAGLVLLAITMVLLPLSGCKSCKSDSVSEPAGGTGTQQPSGGDSTSTETPKEYAFPEGVKVLTDYTSPNHTGSEWTYVAFGEWPQTVMESGVSVDTTKSKQMGMFTYYLGSDGNHYVEAKEKAYAPFEYTNGQQAGRGGTTTKYFKVEPIVWRVLNKDYATTGTALLLAENILAGGVLYYVDTSLRVWGETVYANNWQYSTIRAWLNGSYEAYDTQEKIYGGKGFLQSAFTTPAQGLIAKTTVDNSADSTTDAGNNLPLATNSACANTTDKIFLLSEREATTGDYGFAAYDNYGQGNTRIRMTTDYAKATGAYQDSREGYGGWWWLRSPRYNHENNARIINSVGDAGDYDDVSSRYGGVVPALCVQLE